MSELAPYQHQSSTIDEMGRKRRAKIDVNNLAAPVISGGIEQTNINHYRTKNTGHGHSAEDANALNDFQHGRKVELTGKTRELKILLHRLGQTGNGLPHLMNGHEKTCAPHTRPDGYAKSLQSLHPGLRS